MVVMVTTAVMAWAWEDTAVMAWEDMVATAWADTEATVVDMEATAVG